MEEKSNVEIALDDFIGFCLSVGKENVEGDLRLAIEKTEEKLFWYKVLLEGIRKRRKEEERERKKIIEEIIGGKRKVVKE